MIKWKVTLADDSYPVLEFLSEVIPWESLGFQVIGMHQNGQEALALMTSEMPHVLITDIGMPEMDGLELIREARRISPRLKVIILSCHDEFHYAQQAIKLNVNDYVLKETMEPESIIQLLQGIQRDLREENDEQQNRDRLRCKLDQNLSSLKEAFIRSTLFHPVYDPERWEKEAREYGVDLEGSNYTAVLCYVNRYQQVKERFRTGEAFKYALDNALNELAAGIGGVSFPYSEEESILFLPASAVSKHRLMEQIVPKLQVMQAEFERLLKISLSFGISNTFHTVQDMKLQLKELIDSKDLRFYARLKSIWKTETIKNEEEDIYSIYPQALEEAKLLITEGAPDRVSAVLHQWDERLRAKRWKAEEVRGWVLKLLSDIDHSYRSLQDYQSVYTMELLHNQWGEIRSLEELMEQIGAYLTSKIEYVNNLQQESHRKEVIEAKKYVRTHLSQKIGMEEVARRLHLNASHFSKIFKQATGETFVEFVTRVKMERAEEYLSGTDQSVEQIAELLGYENVSYFIKLFKSHRGVSPLNFRKQTK
ncbi:response regulator transcription factor [Paenibacillus silviterrae]|uniref:response regulator transcription factor n=1 Tax=Paenibacillus silviterrae TaxID=3242194 RepID=UPI0025427B8A|nr:helix-turn-helix domain-containing protein [Paenibacillus chinjuensis]